MEEGDGGQDGVLSRAGEEEAGRVIQNAFFLCIVSLFFCLAELGRRKSGSPGMTRCSWARDIGLKAEKWSPPSRQQQAAALALQDASSGIANKRQTTTNSIGLRLLLPAPVSFSTVALGFAACIHSPEAASSRRGHALQIAIQTRH